MGCRSALQALPQALQPVTFTVSPGPRGAHKAQAGPPWPPHCREGAEGQGWGQGPTHGCAGSGSGRAAALYTPRADTPAQAASGPRALRLPGTGPPPGRLGVPTPRPLGDGTHAQAGASLGHCCCCRCPQRGPSCRRRPAGEAQSGPHSGRGHGHAAPGSPSGVGPRGWHSAKGPCASWQCRWAQPGVCTPDAG